MHATMNGRVHATPENNIDLKHPKLNGNYP